MNIKQVLLDKVQQFALEQANKKVLKHQKKYQPVIEKLTIAGHFKPVMPYNGEENMVIHGTEVLWSDDFLAMHGIMVAGAGLDFTGRFCIIVDSHFLSLPDESQRAILEHEKGHYQLGHLVNPPTVEERAKASIFGVHKTELEADAYCASQCSPQAMIGALEDMLILVPGLNRVEIKRRIKALRRLQRQTV